MAERRAGVRGVTGRTVVEDIVDENGVLFRKRISVMRIRKNVVEPGPSAADRFRVRAELLAGGIGNQTVLKRDVRDGNGLPIIADTVDVIPRRKLQRNVVADNVPRVRQRQRIIAGAGRVAARTDADAAAHDVAAIGKRNFATFETDATARSRLPRNRKAAAARHRSFQSNVAADIKNDDAAAVADRIPKRAGPAVRQRCDMIHRATAAARSIGAKAERTGKGEGLRRGILRQQCEGDREK